MHEHMIAVIVHAYLGHHHELALGFPKEQNYLFFGNGRFNGATSIVLRTLKSSRTSTSIFKQSTTEHKSHKYGSWRSRQAQDSSPRDQSKYSEVHQHFHAYTSELSGLPRCWRLFVLSVFEVPCVLLCSRSPQASALQPRKPATCSLNESADSVVNCVAQSKCIS